MLIKSSLVFLNKIKKSSLVFFKTKNISNHTLKNEIKNISSHCCKEKDVQIYLLFMFLSFYLPHYRSETKLDEKRKYQKLI